MRQAAFFFSGMMMAALANGQEKKPFDLAASMARGKDIYSAYCASCHMENGEGMPGFYPPVAKSDYMMADKNRSIREILYGVSGEMIVNGKKYNLEMSGFDLTDTEVADVLNYMRNSFGNRGAVVTPAEVRAQRKK
jgi:nitrite reductase (NO-forming)